MIANLPSFTLPKIDGAKAGKAVAMAVIWTRRSALSTWPACKWLWRASGWISASTAAALWLLCLRDETGFSEVGTQWLDDARALMAMGLQAAGDAGHVAAVTLMRLPVAESIAAVALIASYGVVWAVRVIRSKPAPQAELELSAFGMLWRGMAWIIGGILLVGFQVYWLRQTDGLLMRDYSVGFLSVTDTRDGLLMMIAFGAGMLLLGASYLNHWKNARRDRLTG